MTSDNENNKKSPEQVWFDELRYWPYTIHQIDDTLDAELIEGRAKQILFQSLNNQSVTAFVGSGVSAAYGRMGWSEWKDEQLRTANDLGKKFSALTQASSDLIGEIVPRLETYQPQSADLLLIGSWLRNRRQVIQRAQWDVTNLLATFRACDSKSGSFPGGEDAPVLFEVAKKLHDLIIRNHQLFYLSTRVHPDEPVFWSKFKSETIPSKKKELLENVAEEIKQELPTKRDALRGKLAYFLGCTVSEDNGAPVNSLQSYFDMLVEKQFVSEYELSFTKYGVALTDFCEHLGDEFAMLKFDDLAKSLLVDECAHAKSLLQIGLSSRAKGGRLIEKSQNYDDEAKKLLSKQIPGPLDNLKRDLDGIRKRPERYKVLGYFQIKALKEFIDNNSDEFPEIWQPLFEDFKNNWQRYTATLSPAPLEAKRQYLTPTSRFLVPVVLQLLKNPLQHTDQTNATIKELCQPTKPDDFVSRRSIIARSLDPIERLSEKLQVSRYLTTNYDFELERFFEDKGYRRFDPHQSLPEGVRASDDPGLFRTNGLGGVMHDLTFQSQTAADLVAFSAVSDDADVSIFHLHGRATTEDDIVVTERDYLDLYLRNNEGREVSDESILMAFAANTMLFTGLGMTEADVLRPLRQFMSDQDRSVGYNAIVLLPADQDYASRAKMSAGLYVRYGAHTIHFGSGEVDVRDGRTQRKQPIDWLHRLSKLIKTLTESAEKRLKDLGERKDLRDPLEQYHDPDAFAALVTSKKLAESVGTLGPDLMRHGSAKPDHLALPYLLGIQDDQWETLEKLKQPEDSKAFQERVLDATTKIQNCHFTSHRHQSGEVPESARTIRINSTTYTEFYVDLLTQLMRIGLQKQSYTDLAEAHRSLNAYITALNGVKGALMTACFNAALDGIASEWRAWWQDWQSMPPEREARLQILASSDNSKSSSVFMPRREVRHRVVSVITDLRRMEDLIAPELDLQDLDYNGERAFKSKIEFQTGVRMYDRFVFDQALMHRERADRDGRVVTTIDATRGQGKGVFFSILSTQLGLSSYIQATHPSRKDKQSNTLFVTATFINFGFATEVGSIYEMLLESLIRTTWQLRVAVKDIKIDNKLKPFDKDYWSELVNFDVKRYPCMPPNDPERAKRHKAEEENLREEIQGLSRFEKIRYLLLAFKAESDKICDPSISNNQFRPRILIALNATDLLFDQRRKPKNREIADYLGLLSSDEMKKVPFDLVTIGSLSEMGHFYGSDTILQRKTYIWSSLHEARKTALQHRARSVGLECKTEDISSDHLQSCRPEPPAKPTHFVHIARRTEALQFIVDNFPLLATALYLARRNRQGQLLKVSPDSQEILASYRRLKRVRDYWWSSVNPPDCNRIYLNSRANFNRRVISCVHRAIKSAKDAREVPANLQVVTDAFIEFKFSGAPIDQLRDYINCLYGVFRPRPHTADEDDWEQLDQALSGNRFCLTILLSAAEQLVLTQHDFKVGGEKANEMLKSVVASLRSASQEKREETVMSAVMSVNRQIAQIGDPAFDYELHQLLLRNIAVLGCPVSPNVLVRLPDIRDYFNAVTFSGKISRRRIVARALATLAERGLVFRLGPHPKLLSLADYVKDYEDAVHDDSNLNDEKYYGKELDKKRSKCSDTNSDKQAAINRIEHFRQLKKTFDGWPPHYEYRYALHRQVQSHCFRRLGLLTAPPITANNFSPTLFAAMPSRVVRLSSEGYLFLRRLLLGLSQYPDIRHGDNARTVKIFNDEDSITRVQALRAALSLARTCYSIAAVSRFDRDGTGLGVIRKRGHFETYRVRLRWILRKAWEVHEPRTKLDADLEERPRKINFRRINALYVDEIVWLYNEVAVTCLVQGALAEALAHIRQAIHVNRQIEHSEDHGRMHNLLSLNCAIIQLERGHLAAAEKRLNQIVASEGEPGRRLSHLARGYLALITQLRGRGSEAETLMLKVIEKLEKENQDRALAIFLQHLARLVSRKDSILAQAYMNRARDYAEKGGHEDVRYRILVSEVWVSQELTPDPQDRMKRDRAKLREAEQYAEAMGIYALFVESLHAQGMILLRAGDYSRAGRLMTKAMAIARRNDMTLRLNSIMTNYAKVLLARRRIASAQRLLKASLALAKRCEYSTEVVRIHAVMDDVEEHSSTEKQ